MESGKLAARRQQIYNEAGNELQQKHLGIVNITVRINATLNQGQTQYNIYQILCIKY